MHIYTGLDYSYKWQHTIQECLKEAKKNPFTTYYVIVKDSIFIEESFLQYTDSLFNIEIITFSELLNKCQISNPNLMTNIQKIILLKKILENNPSNILYQPKNIFTIIADLLPIFDTFYHYGKTTFDPTSFQGVSKDTFVACFSLYQQFLANIPATSTYSTLDNVVPTMSKQVFYIMEDCLLQPSILSFIKKLDEQNTVFILSNHNMEDTRTLQTTYQHYFSEYPATSILNVSAISSFITSQLFSNVTKKYLGEHPFSILKETNPVEEINSVCFSIYQDIVNNQMSYHDFAIVYPNPQYLERIQKTLQSFSIPTNTIAIPKEYPLMTACLSLLEYAKTKKEEDFINLLDSLLLKKCSSFKQIGYYKKQWQEAKNIHHEDYIAFKNHINTYYIEPLITSSTIIDRVLIVVDFFEKEVIHDASIATIHQYFKSLQEHQERITLEDFIQLIQITKPTNKEPETILQDHLYLFNYQQCYSGLLPIKKIYLLGLNETIVPTTIKNEGILLDEEKTILGLKPTIIDELSLQQNHFLKLLTAPATTIVLSYAMASTTNDTLLPSSYVLHLQELFDIPAIQTDSYYQHPAVAHRLYALGGEDAHNTLLHQNIAFYKQRKNQPEKLVTLPYPSQMSASQLETYNGCPYKYFCQYGLNLQPMQSATLQANEIGTLVHKVLEKSTPFFKNREQTRNIDTDTIKKHLQQTIQAYLSNHKEIQVKLQQISNQFLIECIEEDLFNTVLILINQMAASSFHIENTEEKLQAMYHGIEMKGFVDRVDAFSNYVNVIDYKSSDKDLDLSLAMQGFNIQMLVYMDILASQKQLEKGALLYFNTKKRILKSTLSICEPEVAENFFKQYRMNGYVVEDVVEEIDGQIDSTSQIIKVRHVKKEDTYKGNVISQEELQRLLVEVGKHITYIYEQIFSGNIFVHPKASNDATIHTKVNPCAFCPYRAICNLDVFYNAPILVKNLDVNKIIGGEKDDTN